MTINETVKTATDMTAKGMDRFNSMAELNMRTWERLAGRQMDVFGLWLEQGMRLATLATESKSYTDYVKGQVEIAKDVSERMMAETKTNMQLLGEVRDDYRVWYERGMSELSSELRQAVAA
ncbi:phasin family protein [Thiococcus pfennigii]|jgi:hypothetical protein|uniref:phasin family protein n=1 Tax=Thiococcus pfennigii TaxID=1057 RepID=UPI00190533E4|nr:phasin family protein [Thiococcus pfennigii]MBK1732597.1 hypothetical protein [Thiococcus pfennigii]